MHVVELRKSMDKVHSQQTTFSMLESSFAYLFFVILNAANFFFDAITVAQIKPINVSDTKAKVKSLQK